MKTANSLRFDSLLGKLLGKLLRRHFAVSGQLVCEARNFVLAFQRLKHSGSNHHRSDGPVSLVDSKLIHVHRQFFFPKLAEWIINSLLNLLNQFSFVRLSSCLFLGLF